MRIVSGDLDDEVFYLNSGNFIFLTEIHVPKDYFITVRITYNKRVRHCYLLLNTKTGELVPVSPNRLKDLQNKGLLPQDFITGMPKKVAKPDVVLQNAEYRPGLFDDH